jgi:hypothetical protein
MVPAPQLLYPSESGGRFRAVARPGRRPTLSEGGDAPTMIREHHGASFQGNRRHQSAYWAIVDHTFWPLTT